MVLHVNVSEQGGCICGLLQLNPAHIPLSCCLVHCLLYNANGARLTSSAV